MMNLIPSIALPSAAILALFFAFLQTRKDGSNVYTGIHGGFVCTGLIVTLLLLFPTRKLLAVYQPPFYSDYHLSALLPVIPITAYAFTYLFGHVPANCGDSLKQRYRYRLALSGGFVILCILASSFHFGTAQTDPASAGMTADIGKFDSVIERINELTVSEDAQSITVYGPFALLQQIALCSDPDIHLVNLYGRNMWTQILAGYTFDTYSEELNLIFQYMCDLENLGITENNAEEIRACWDALPSYGVDVIVVPLGKGEESDSFTTSNAKAFAAELGYLNSDSVSCELGTYLILY